MGDATALNGLQSQQCIKSLHDRNGSSHFDYRHAVAKWCSMVKRCGRQVMTVGVITKQWCQQFHQHGVLSCCRLRQRPQDTLGTSCCARGVKHVAALQSLFDGRGGLLCTLRHPISVPCLFTACTHAHAFQLTG